MSRAWPALNPLLRGLGLLALLGAVSLLGALAPSCGGAAGPTMSNGWGDNPDARLNACLHCASTCCNNRCIEVNGNDPKNCGACGHTCDDNEECISGTCQCNHAGPCAEGQVCCGSGGCRNTQNDAQNCGGCNQACDQTADTCSSGSCTCGGAAACTGGQSCCSGACIDVNGSDTNNCGGCGLLCNGTCASGSCQGVVGGTCMTDTDCNPGETCVAGMCTGSGGMCVTDADCGPGGLCFFGMCLGGGMCNPPCPAGQQCLLGFCF